MVACAARKASDKPDDLQHRKVDIRLPGKGNSNSRGARPVYQSHHGDKVDSDQ